MATTSTTLTTAAVTTTVVPVTSSALTPNRGNRSNNGNVPLGVTVRQLSHGDNGLVPEFLWSSFCMAVRRAIVSTDPTVNCPSILKRIIKTPFWLPKPEGPDQE